MNFAFIDTDGQVMAIQSSPKAPAPTKWETEYGYARVELPADLDTPVSRDTKVVLENGVVVDVIESVNPVQPTRTYQEKRAAEYPPVEDQLDMIYHDQLDGGTRFRDAIQAVKEKYPKPN